MTKQEAYEQWYRDGLARAMSDCASKPGFIEHFNRLTGSNFGPHCVPGDADSLAFMTFVDDYVWSWTVKEMDKAVAEAELN
jgi:hypothetical protein